MAFNVYTPVRPSVNIKVLRLTLVDVLYAKTC